MKLPTLAISLLPLLVCTKVLAAPVQEPTIDQVVPGGHYQNDVAAYNNAVKNWVESVKEAHQSQVVKRDESSAYEAAALPPFPPQPPFPPFPGVGGGLPPFPPAPPFPPFPGSGGLPPFPPAPPFPPFPGSGGGLPPFPPAPPFPPFPGTGRLPPFPPAPPFPPFPGRSEVESEPSEDATPSE